MVLTLIWFLPIGLIAAWLVSKVMGDDGLSAVVYTVIGVVGALLGVWLSGVLPIFSSGGMVVSLMTAFAGAFVLILLVRVLHRASRSSPKSSTTRQLALAAVGVLVALVILLGIVPKLLETRQRNLVKRTADMQTISQALEDYAAEQHVYPVAHSMEQLKARLVRKDGTPWPIRDRWNNPANLPMRDPWGRPFLIDVSQQNYSIRSLGSDGKRDPDPPRGGLLDTEPPDRDTIIVDGLALQHPWNYGGGGSTGGSSVSLGRDGDAGTIIMDGGPVELIRNGRAVASLSEAPARFQGPAGEYALRVGSSGSQSIDAGTVVIESGKVLQKKVVLPPSPADATVDGSARGRGGVHLSLEGPIAINGGSVNGWSVLARQDHKVIVQTDRFPHFLFLPPGRCTVELIHDGHVRSSKMVDVTAISEQWIALQE